MDWEQYVYGIIAFSIIIPSIGFVGKRVYHFLKTSRAEISLKVPDNVLNSGTTFGLLHIRDGKDEVSDSGLLLNKEIFFNKMDQRGNFIISLNYTKNLGFQFKCFADYTGITFEQLKETLEKNGYRDVSKGEGKMMRAWFIHPDYSTYATVDNFLNNYYYPS